MLEDFDIRYSGVQDEDFLRKCLLDPSILEFFPMDHEPEIQNAIKAWASFFRYRASLTATIKGVPCGIATLFLMPYKKVSHHCIFKIVVDPKFQKKGIGTDLLKNIQHLAKQYFHLEMLFIDVFDHNPLIGMLHKDQFETYAVEEDYVKIHGVYHAKHLLRKDLL